MSLKNFAKYSILSSLFKNHKLNRFKRIWREKNTHNSTIPACIFNEKKVLAGNHCYGRLTVINYSDQHFLRIGNYVSIADGVSFIIDAEHYLNHISTYPFKVMICKSTLSESFGKGDIIIDDDVWIGYGATILSGVHIGQGAVIAAGAVVSKNVEPYSIVGGVPAKLLRYRFSEGMIQFLMTLDYSQLTEDMVKKHCDVLYKDYPFEIEELLAQLSWFPKKSTICNKEA